MLSGSGRVERHRSSCRLSANFRHIQQSFIPGACVLKTPTAIEGVMATNRYANSNCECPEIRGSFENANFT